MRIGIDASNIRVGGGVTHLIEILKAAKPEEHGISRVVVWVGQKTLSRLPTQPWLELVHLPVLDKKLPARLYWQKFELSKLAQKHCDLLWIPGGNYSGSFRPFVAMSRNLIPFELLEMKRYGYSQKFLKMALLRFAQAATFQRADGMIFLTNHAKKTVQKYAKYEQGISTIIPHGVNEKFRRLPQEQKEINDYSFAYPFRLLYVSIIDLYKHQWQVALAVAKLREEGFPIILELVGSAANALALKRFQNVIKQVDPEGVFIGYKGAIPYTELHSIYHQADAFIFASSCENMPNILLEAMASGLPIACSDRGSMPEVLGDAGVYFDPEQSRDIADALRTLLKDTRYRQVLATKAYHRALSYSWENCAKETFSFLVKVFKRVQDESN